MQHITVLQHEAVDLLALKPASVVVDATMGSGGHGRAIISELGGSGVYIGIDADHTSIDAAQKWSKGATCTVHLVHDNFRNLSAILKSHAVSSPDAILADLGWRIEQFEGSGKGFSFKVDEPLLMTFGDPEDYPFTAADIVNEWDEEVLANIFYGYAEERFSRRIAKAIIETRAKELIQSSVQLADIISRAIPKRFHGKTHPATKSFQALRIAVNDEFTALEEFLYHALQALAPGGRLAVISFHSLEDRIVKQTFLKYTRDHEAVLVTKKPVTASPEELQANPRARSAKLRVIETQS